MAGARAAAVACLIAAVLGHEALAAHAATTQERTSSRAQTRSTSSGFSSGSFSSTSASRASGDNEMGSRGGGGGGGLLGGRSSSGSSSGGLLLGGGKSMILGGGSRAKETSSSDDSDSSDASSTTTSKSTSTTSTASPAAKTAPSPPSVQKAVANVETGSTASASGDPQFVGWNGKTWFFNGESGKTYNIISSKNYQLAARMKKHVHPGWTHEGTDMDGIGFQYRDYRVVVELLRVKQGGSILVTDEIQVLINGKPLKQKRFGTHVQRRAYRFADGTAVELTWNLFKVGIGNTVSIDTEMLQAEIYVTPHGTTEGDSYAVDAYLNFNLTLKAPPHGNRMTGAMGDTYTHFRAGEAVGSTPNTTYYDKGPAANDWAPRHKEAEYEVANYFDTHYPLNLFGLEPLIRERESLEVSGTPEARPVPQAWAQQPGRALRAAARRWRLSQ